MTSSSQFRTLEPFFTSVHSTSSFGCITPILRLQIPDFSHHTYRKFFAFCLSVKSLASSSKSKVGGP